MRAGIIEGDKDDLLNLIQSVADEVGSSAIHGQFFDYSSGGRRWNVWVISDTKVSRKAAYDFAVNWLRREYGVGEADKFKASVEP